MGKTTTELGEPCPCGSSLDYQACCLETEDSVVLGGVRSRRRAAREQDLRDQLLEPFEEMEQPTPEDVDRLLRGLLPLSPGVVDWSEVLDLIAQHPELDLIGPYRKIAEGVPDEPASQLHYVFWSAAAGFSRRGQIEMLAEVADAFCGMNPQSMDPDAAEFIEDCLLQAHLDESALALVERCLPHLRARYRAGQIPGSGLVVQSKRAFYLRMGRLLHPGVEGMKTLDAVSAHLSRELPGLLPAYVESVYKALQHCVPRTQWSREDFALPHPLTEGQTGAAEVGVRLHESLLAVALEGWQIDEVPPACGLQGLNDVLECVYEDRERTSRAAPPESPPRDNLLDWLKVPGLRDRIRKSCSSLMMFSFPRALLMVEAHQMLLEIARRHSLLPTRQVNAVAAELEHLHTLWSRQWQAGEM